MKYVLTVIGHIILWTLITILALLSITLNSISVVCLCLWHFKFRASWMKRFRYVYWRWPYEIMRAPMSFKMYSLKHWEIVTRVTDSTKK